MVGRVKLLPHRVRALALTAIGIVLFGVDDPGTPANQVEVHLELDPPTQLASVWHVMSAVPSAPSAPLSRQLSLLGTPGAFSFPEQSGAAQLPLLLRPVGVQHEHIVAGGGDRRGAGLMPALSFQTGHLLLQCPGVLQPLGEWPGDLQDSVARGKSDLRRSDSELLHPYSLQAVRWLLLWAQLGLVENLNGEWALSGEVHRAGQLQPELRPCQVLFLAQKGEVESEGPVLPTHFHI